MNAWLLDRCIAYAKAHRHPEFTDKTIWEVFEAERPKLVPYAGRFDGFHAVPASVSKTCLVRFDNNKYSVAASAVGRPVEVQAYADRIVIRQDGRIVAEHQRSFDRGQTIYDPWHYVPVLARKPGALRNGAPFKDWVLPASDHKAPRGLDRALFQKLIAGEWIARHQNLLVIGPTGVGKSWIACALGHKACRDDRSVLYHRVPRLFDALALARGGGRYARLLKNLARADLLILDDWGLAPLTPEQAHDLLEIIDDRHGRGSTIVTSQLPVDHWHEVIANPTIADAILDRLVHNAHRLTLKGDSMRKIAAKRSGQPSL